MSALQLCTLVPVPTFYARLCIFSVDLTTAAAHQPYSAFGNSQTVALLNAVKLLSGIQQLPALHHLCWALTILSRPAWICSQQQSVI